MFPSHDARHRISAHYAWGVCGFLLVAVGLIYAQTLRYALLYFDDNVFVFANRHVSAGLTDEGIRWAFNDGPYGEWYPLAVLSQMVDCQLFGLRAWGHHLTNVLLHAAASIGLFFVWWRMTDELWPSAFVASVFAVHPQHVESVAWVSERRDVLSGLFFMLTLMAWLGYLRHGRTTERYLLVAVLFAFGLMSKPMLVTLPALLLLLDFWPLARFGAASNVPGWTRQIERPSVQSLILEKLPLAAIAAGDCLMTLRTHADAGAPLAWSERFGNAAVCCVTYVAQFFCPVELAAHYPLPPGGPPAWKVAWAIAILIGTCAAAAIWRRRFPSFFVGWFWYLVALSPVLGVVKVGRVAMADRYMYLPSIGLSVVVAWQIARLVAARPQGRWLVGAGAGLVVAILIGCAARQTSFWRDDETLWRHVLACTTDNHTAEIGMANALTRQGRLDDAIPYYRRAQRLTTDSAPYNNLGLLFARQGKVVEATDQFRQAVAVEPDSYQAHANLGVALAEQNRADEAKQHFRRALEINPRDVTAHNGLAHLLLFERKIDEAVVELELAVESEPGNIAIRNDLAAVLFDQGKIEPSIAQFEAALMVDPQSTPTHINLARVLVAGGRIDEAMTHYRRALDLDPGNAVARDNLAKLLRGNAGQPAP